MFCRTSKSTFRMFKSLLFRVEREHPCASTRNRQRIFQTTHWAPQAVIQKARMNQPAPALGLARLRGLSHLQPLREFFKELPALVTPDDIAKARGNDMSF